MEQCKGAELEAAHPIGKIMKTIVWQTLAKSKISVKNDLFSNSINQNKRHVAVLCEDKVIVGKIHSWKDFVERLMDERCEDWLTVLKAALQIYEGELRGFAMLPACSEQRSLLMKDYMKDLLLKMVKNVLDKHKSGTPKQAKALRAIGSSFSIEDVALKLSIEYCLAIKEVKFLFSEVLTLFRQNGLEDAFVSHLKMPILAG